MKIILHQFQREAARAGFRTLEELNSAFWAWMELDYNTRVHSSTGQSPTERFQQGLPQNHRRVTDLAAFQALFLWRLNRTVTKYGRVKLFGNQYPVTARPPRTVVQVRYDPFDLQQVAIYDPQHLKLLETTSVTQQLATQAPTVPEESRSRPPEVSQNARRYFSRLREQHQDHQKQLTETSFRHLLPEDSAPKEKSSQETSDD